MEKVPFNKLTTWNCKCICKCIEIPSYCNILHKVVMQLGLYLVNLQATECTEEPIFVNFSCQQIKVNLIWLTWSLIKFNAELLLSIKSMRNCEKKTARTPQKLATTNFNDSMVFQYWIYMQAYFCLVACYSVLCIKFSSGFFFHLDKAYLNFYSFCCILVCGTPIFISFKSFSSWYLGLY